MKRDILNLLVICFRLYRVSSYTRRRDAGDKLTLHKRFDAIQHHAAQIDGTKQAAGGHRKLKRGTSGTRQLTGNYSICVRSICRLSILSFVFRLLKTVIEFVLNCAFRCLLSLPKSIPSVCALIIYLSIFICIVFFSRTICKTREQQK